MSFRALAVTVIGAVALAGGILFMVNGFMHRFEAAQSAITVQHGKEPAFEGQHLYFSASGEAIDPQEFVESMRGQVRGVVLQYAERTGSFSVPSVTVYVDGSSMVALSGAAPFYPLVSAYYGGNVWEPHAYMIPGFLGALTMLGGLFWLAARWHVTQPDRRREIDERRV